MEKKTALISIVELAKGLEMDRSNLKKLILKLEIEPKRIRGNQNQWTQAFSTEDVDTILEYREGLKHSLVKSKGIYTVKEA